MSIFTSQYPPTHKVIHIFENGLDNGTWTLPQVLKLYGYRAAWFAPTEDPHLDPALGFGRGFDVTQPVDLRNPADKERIFDWIRSEPDQKFFLFLHTYAVHEPYVPSAPYDKMFDPDYNGSIVGEKSQYYTLLDEYLKENNLTNIAYTDIESYRKTENITLTVYWARANLSSPRDVYHLSALYDGEIRNLDANFSDFIGFFSSPDIRRKTIVIITADHGEEFGEHGQFHHTDLHNEVLHVPLVIIAPGIGNGSVDPQVQSIDIAPTVLDMLGIQAPHGFQGKSLLPLIKGQIGQLDPYTYAYHYGTASVRSEKWKYIAENFDTRTASYLYDVSVDPRETINLADSNPDTAFMMKGILKKWMTENAANSSQVVNWGPMIGYP
jgi:arylsulfatase A-like enzyme